MKIERMVLEEKVSWGGSGAELKSIIPHRKQKNHKTCFPTEACGLSCYIKAIWQLSIKITCTVNGPLKQDGFNSSVQ